MKDFLCRKTSLLVVGIAFANSAFAGVTAEEAKQLGGPTLTVWGAEKAGNKEGTIPAYTGEPIKIPASYNPKNPMQHPDPFQEKPLFTITAQNAAQYSDKLTEGLKAVFKTYPNFRMDVYPTHRTAQFPQYVLDNTIKNATACKAVNNELNLENCYGGFPFPIPKTGNQVMWNHLVGFEAYAWDGKTSNWVVTPTGPAVLQAMASCYEEVPFYNPAKTSPNGEKDVYWRVRCDDTAPARRVGQKLILIDALDQVNIGRRAYQYIPGQRRVKLAPDLSYDTPNPYSGGASTMDDAKGFLGALDRFDFKLIGKQEKFILHNAFGTVDAKTCPDEKFVSTKYFAHPECLRWELHRVWVVESKLKPGFRHIYAKRTFYWDEDGYLAGQNEAYDAGGRLFRVTLPLHFNMYEGKAQTAGTSIAMDLNTGTYMVNGSHNCDGCGWTPMAKSHGDTYYSPEALAGEGIR